MIGFVDLVKVVALFILLFFLFHPILLASSPCNAQVLYNNNLC